MNDLLIVACVIPLYGFLIVNGYIEGYDYLSLANLGKLTTKVMIAAATSGVGFGVMKAIGL